MITQKFVFKSSGRLSGTTYAGKTTAFVQVTITGRADLDKFADIVEKLGRANLAATVRKASRVRMNLTPEEAKQLVTEAK